MKKWEKVNSATKITKLSALFAYVCVWVCVYVGVCVCGCVYSLVFLLLNININVGRCGKQASFFYFLSGLFQVKEILWLGDFVVVVVYAALTSLIFVVLLAGRFGCNKRQREIEIKVQIN